MTVPIDRPYSVGLRAAAAAALAFVLSAAGCDCGGEPPADPPADAGVDPFADYVQDPTIFAAAVDFDDDDQAVDYETQRIARDQLVLVMTDDASEDEVSEALEALEATIVGQIPDLGLYQVALDAHEVDALDDAQQAAAALPGVEHATFNHTMAFKQTPDYCHAGDDLHLLEGADRCVPRDTGYFQMVPIVEELKKHTSLSDVRVAVIDTGVEQQVAELQTVTKLNLGDGAKGFPTTDPDGHGTRVAGVIAASNENGGVNGIAYRVLGHRLSLLVGRSNGNFEAATMIRRALNARADVVNMSFGTNFTGEELLMAAADNAMYWRTFAKRPETLFVMSAGNENLVISALDYSPIGNGVNTLVVGASAACDAETRWYVPPEEGQLFSLKGSNRGPMVDLAAPGERVPLVRYNPDEGVNETGSHAVYFRTGTSYAAPQVAALGAILKAFDSSLSGQQTRDYVLSYSYPGDAEMGNRRLILPLAIEQLMIDRDPSAAVTKLIDADPPEDEWDLPSMVVNRICGGAELTVSGWGTLRYAPTDDQGGALNALVLAISFVEDQDLPADEQVSITFSHFGEFILELYQEYNVPMPFSIQFSDGTDASVGNGTSGTVNFTECAITERFQDAAPATIELGGVIDGYLEIITPPSITPGAHTISGTFHVPVLLNQLTEAQLAALESQCVGGTDAD